MKRYNESREAAYEEAYNFIDYGLTTFSKIYAECKEIARDKEAAECMIEQAGSIEEYAKAIFETVEEILAQD